MANSVQNIKIEPADLFWEVQQLDRITAVADSAGSLNDTYFLVSVPTDADVADDYYVWYNVNSAGTDPALAGKTGIEVALATGATAIQVASATATAIDAVSAFNSSVDYSLSSRFMVQAKYAGTTGVASADSGTATGFTFTAVRSGDKFPVGFIDGSIEIGLSEDLVDVTAQQTGSNIIERIRSGRNIDAISIPMKETSAAKIKEIVEAGGSTFTPSGGTELSGWGNAQDFDNVSSDSRKLVFHPVRKLSTDRSTDWCFWRAYPVIDALNFSGEDTQLLTVSFSILPDEEIRQDGRLFVYGDHTQNVLRT